MLRKLLGQFGLIKSSILITAISIISSVFLYIIIGILLHRIEITGILVSALIPLMITPALSLFFLRLLLQLDLAEKALRESEERLSGILSSLYETMIVGYDRFGRHLFAWGDPQLDEIYGLNGAKIVGTSLKDLFPEKDTDKKIRQIQHIFDTGQKHREEIKIHFPHGEFWHDVSFSPMCGPSGEVTAVVGFIRDITEQKKAQAALKESEERLRLVADGLPVLIAYVDSDRRYQFVNKEYEDWFGLSRSEIIGRRVSDLMDEAHYEDIRSGIETALSGQFVSFERQMRLENDEMRHFHTRNIPHVAADGATLGYFVLEEDITERKQAEMKLREKEHIIESASIIIATMDLDGAMSYVNPAFLKTWGFEDKADVRHKPFWEFWMVGERLDEFMWALHNDGQWTGEIKARKRNGALFDVQVLAAMVRDKDGKPLSMMSSSVDITERKEAEREKEKLEAQLRQSQKMEAIGTLSSGVAHDFNNILQAINGYVQLLSTMEGLDRRARHYSLEIDSAAQRATDLVQRLLAFSRKVEPELTPVDIKQEVFDAVKMLARTIPKMIDIETDLAEDLMMVNADKNQINQVLMNLCANARDAMPHGGRLLIQGENIYIQDNEPGVYSDLAPGRYVRLQVSDNGTGMDEKTLKYIFDPFYTTKEIGKGTGLGLSMAYGIVNNHGGHITCSSRPGRGTRFSICLPAITDRGIIKPNNQIETANDNLSGHETILLVDDEKPVIETIKDVFTMNSYSVLTAASGEEALELYKENGKNIDLVILDLGMPGMGGHKCLEELLKLDPQVKIIMASGYSIDGQLKQAIKQGAKGFVGKPYRLATMLKKAREVLDDENPG